jgi:hypothetical protein
MRWDLADAERRPDHVVDRHPLVNAVLILVGRTLVAPPVVDRTAARFASTTAAFDSPLDDNFISPAGYFLLGSLGTGMVGLEQGVADRILRSKSHSRE